MSKFVTNRLDLGKRVGGYTCYDSKSKEFDEYTPKQVKELIASGGVYGLKVEGDEIILDKENFNMQDLMIKSGVGNYRPMNSMGSLINTLYAVVKVMKEKSGVSYEVVSDKAARIELSEERLKMYMELDLVSGVYLDDSNAVQVCAGVEIEDKANEKKVTVLKTKADEKDKAV